MNQQKNDEKANWIERPVEIRIEFESNGRKPVPTVAQIRQYYDVNLSFYSTGNKFEDPMYIGSTKPPALLPVRLCSDLQIWENGTMKNASNYEVKQDIGPAGEYIVWSEITVAPLEYVNANINVSSSTFSMDVVKPDPDESGIEGRNSGAMDGDVFDNRLKSLGICRYIERNGYRKVIGMNSEYGTMPTTYDDEGMASNSYVYYGIIILLSLNAGGKDHFWSRLAYPKQAEEFFQSGHGLGTQGAGLIYNKNENDYFPLRKNIIESEHYAGEAKEVPEVLKLYWGSSTSNLKVLVLNSCYNGNVTIENNAYPNPSKIWDDCGTDYITDPRNDGRGNNIFKWFESMGKNGAVCGWGQSTIYDAAENYEMFGRRRVLNTFTNSRYAKGQGPADRQIKKDKYMDWFTKEVVDEFKRRKVSVSNSAAIALAWIKSVESVVNQYEFTSKFGSNTFNAISLGIDKTVSPNVVRIYGLNVEKNSGDTYYTATGRQIAVCAITNP